MARKIKLRYDATCFDCDAPLAAGTYARWFGKGRCTCLDDEGCKVKDNGQTGVTRPSTRLTNKSGISVIDPVDGNSWSDSERPIDTNTIPSEGPLRIRHLSTVDLAVYSADDLVSLLAATISELASRNLTERSSV